MNGLVWLFLVVCCLCLCGSTCYSYSISPPRGCAKAPAQKKNVALLGGGGYLGAVAFGYLQRAGSLFGTGIGKARCIGATADTASRMNRILTRHFGLAFADESVIKLTDLRSVSALTSRLTGYDALILGTDMKMDTRAVFAGTYDKTPNDKAWEVYWDEPKGSFTGFDFPVHVKDEIVVNTLEAAKAANVQHIVVVDDGSVVPKLDQIGIPYTCIIQPTTMSETTNWSYQKGVCETVSIKASTETGHSIRREDLAALCVQALQSLPWECSRILSVSATGEPVARTSNKRVDQQWCIHSVSLEETFATIP